MPIIAASDRQTAAVTNANSRRNAGFPVEPGYGSRDWGATNAASWDRNQRSPVPWRNRRVCQL